MSLKNLVLAAFVVFTSSAAIAEEIGTVTTKGLIFKDSITISAFDDPDYPYVTCYVTTADRSLSFENPSDSSIACRLIGESNKNDNIVDKSDVFKSGLNLFFKYQKVDRFYDPTRNVLVYISYVRATGGENHSHAISVVPLGK